MGNPKKVGFLAEADPRIGNPGLSRSFAFPVGFGLGAAGFSLEGCRFSVDCLACLF